MTTANKPFFKAALIITTTLIVGSCNDTPLDPPTVHRVQALTCEGVFAPPEPVYTYDCEACTTHADCTEGDNGRCNNPEGIIGACYCTYDTCKKDDDCPTDKVCYCAEDRAAHCLNEGNCRVDADCGKDGFCSPSFVLKCSGWDAVVGGYHCHTSADKCNNDADCGESEFCNFNLESERWECEGVGVCATP